MPKTRHVPPGRSEAPPPAPAQAAAVETPAAPQAVAPAPVQQQLAARVTVERQGGAVLKSPV